MQVKYFEVNVIHDSFDHKLMFGIKIFITTKRQQTYPQNKKTITSEGLA